MREDRRYHSLRDLLLQVGFEPGLLRRVQLHGFARNGSFVGNFQLVLELGFVHQPNASLRGRQSVFPGEKTLEELGHMMLLHLRADLNARKHGIPPEEMLLISDTLVQPSVS